ncbi:MAG: hypothetical protein CVU95_03050 [Firmicutes bacterium HGW-Firmicutes-2]|jgi:predicted phage tail protein|nr:MAG: hypothetical protein CVU95_03050 [Firmicutes bacterium HGW-Firmicutes-2]
MTLRSLIKIIDKSEKKNRLFKKKEGKTNGKTRERQRSTTGSEAVLVEDLAIKVKEGVIMLNIIAVVLVVLWILGMVTSYTIGGFIHVLLVIAIIIVLLRVIKGNKVL